jgi:hypothetical protein
MQHLPIVGPALIIAMAMMLLAGSSIHAIAGAYVGCGEPFVFQGSPVNVIVVQYRFDEGKEYDAEFSKMVLNTAVRLTWLIKLDLFLNANYGGLGIVSHLEDRHPERCNADEIENTLYRGLVTPQQGLVIVSGRIYQKGEDIFFQTYAKRVRLSKEYPTYPENDTVKINVPDRRGETLELTAAIPGETIIFPPRRLRVADLMKVEMIFNEAAKVHTRPDDEQVAYTIELNPRNPAAFAVTNIRSDGWIEIKSFFDDREGWVRLKPEDAAIVHGFLPELDLIDGLVGYLRLRQAFVGGRFEANPLPMINPMNQSFLRYAERGPTVAGTQPVAVALSLSGTAFLLRGGKSAAQMALDQYKKAIEKQPYNADLLNLKAIAEANLGFRYGDPTSAVQVVRSDLLDAISLKPNNTLTIGNLDVLYSYLTNKPQILAAMPDKPTPDQLQSSRRRLQKMQELLLKK